MEKDPHNNEIMAGLQQLKQEKSRFNEKMKQMSQKMLGSLDYSEHQIKEKKITYGSKIKEKIKGIWGSFKYHCKMVYLIPLGFISERCCKKRLPSYFFKKTQ